MSAASVAAEPLLAALSASPGWWWPQNGDTATWISQDKEKPARSIVPQRQVTCTGSSSTWPLEIKRDASSSIKKTAIESIVPPEKLSKEALMKVWFSFMHGNNLVAKTTIPMSVHKFTMNAAPIAAPHLLSEWSWMGASDGAILNESRQSGRVAELALCVDGRNGGNGCSKRAWIIRMHVSFTR